MNSFYSIYSNCFPVKLVVLNPLLNAVTYDVASPDWSGDGPILVFALEVYPKINPFVTLLDQDPKLKEKHFYFVYS